MLRGAGLWVLEVMFRGAGLRTLGLGYSPSREDHAVAEFGGWRLQSQFVSPHAVVC